jgi:hypothetical protein
MRTVIVVTTLLLAVAAVARDEMPPVPAPEPTLQRLPLTSWLDRFAQRAGAKAAGEDFVRAAAAVGLRGRADGLVNVEIVGPVGGAPVDDALIRRHGGEVDAVWRHQTSAWLPPPRARALAGDLPDGYLLRDANLPLDNDEGPGVAGSDTYRDGGADGSGITIGIIDRNFAQLNTLQVTSPGDVPAVIVPHDYTGNGAYSGTVLHGTGQVECVYDHAPGATYHIFRIANSTHLGTAIDDAIDAGVDILSATQSWYNEGWNDGSGTANAAIDEAGDAGILYFNSAGNRAQTHWQGTFADNDGDDWHGWDNGVDEINNFTAGAGDQIFLYLCWDTDPGTTNYDFYLTDTGGNILDSSTSGGETFEKIVWTNPDTVNAAAVGLAVRRVSGSAVEFEVFKHNSAAFEHIVRESSITPPTNNLHANTISIGAVQHWVYDPAQADPIAGYSSVGPTNEGRRVLDLAAPTNTNTVAYGGDFTGTSAATPNAAGIAAALWSSVPQLSAAGVRQLLFHQAELMADWGPAGVDQDYGHGGMFLHPWAADTEWVDRDGGNTGASATLPWYRVSDAYTAVPSGGRILMLGGSYPSPLTMSRPLTMETVVESAVVGD